MVSSVIPNTSLKVVVDIRVSSNVYSPVGTIVVCSKTVVVSAWLVVETGSSLEIIADVVVFAVEVEVCVVTKRDVRVGWDAGESWFYVGVPELEARFEATADERMTGVDLEKGEETEVEEKHCHCAAVTTEGWQMIGTVNGEKDIGLQFHNYESWNKKWLVSFLSLPE